MMECACLVQLWVRYGPSLFTCVATSNSPLDVSTTFRAAEDAKGSHGRAGMARHKFCSQANLNHFCLRCRKH
jgi:hypothetical protein